MIRLLTLFVIVLLAGWSALWFLDRPGVMTISWQGWEIRTTVAFAFLALVVFVLSLIFLSRVIFSLLRVPGEMARHAQEQTRAQGFDAISQGLIAIATGDLKLAKRHARRARALLPDQPLTQVLLAQKAQLDGKEDEARSHFEAMLDSPATELLGRQGLVQDAIKQGDQQKALEHAQRAFQLRPKVEWAYTALLDHQSRANAWDEALSTIEKGRQSGHISANEAKFKKAVFLTAKAYAALEAGNKDKSESLATQAQRLIPGFTPAAVLAARILIERGSQWKAAGILEEAWRAEPHPAIIEAYAAIKPDESVRMRARRLNGLVEMKPDHEESNLLRARIAINTRDWKSARTILQPMLLGIPTPRVCALMAEIEQGELGNIGAAREWMARAVSAPSEPEWLRTDFRFTAGEWGELARELTEWPPKFSERTLEKSIRIAPIHDHAKLLTGEPGEDAGERTGMSGPEDLTDADFEFDADDKPSSATSAQEQPSADTIEPNQVIMSPLRSKPSRAGLLVHQSHAQPTQSSVEIDAAPAKPMPVRKTKAGQKTKAATKKTNPSKPAQQRVEFSLSHQPDDPGSDD